MPPKEEAPIAVLTRAELEGYTAEVHALLDGIQTNGPFPKPDHAKAPRLTFPDRQIQQDQRNTAFLERMREKGVDFTQVEGWTTGVRL